MHDEALAEVIAERLHDEYCDDDECDDDLDGFARFKGIARTALASLDSTAAWVGDTNIDEVQDLVSDSYAHVIDVSNMDPVWIIERLVSADSET